MPFTYSAEDFRAVSSNDVVNVCTLANYADVIEITNTGNTYSKYLVRLKGDASDFVTAVPNQFSLMPGESIQIYNYYHFSRTAAGKYGLKVNIRTSMGIEKELVQEVNSKLCNNNMLLAHNFNQTACPCLEMEYGFTVKNTGSYAEIYTFGLDKFAEYANISMNPLILGSGESENIKVQFNLDCKIYGDYIVNFFSNAQSSGISSKVPLLLTIKKCYDYDIRTGKALDNNDNKFDVGFSSRESSYDICGGDNKSIQVMIDNFGYIGNNFYYDVEGAEWGSAYGDILRLFGYEKGYTYLDLSPGLDMIGEHKFVLNVNSQNGNEKMQRVVTVNVIDCYGLILELPLEETICSCIDSDIIFNLQNTGSFTEEILIDIEGPEFFNLNEHSVDIGSGISREVKILASPGCSVKGKKDVKVMAYLEKGNEYDEGIMSIEVVPIDKCYDLKIDADASVDLGYEEMYFPVTVVHKGIKKANYEVEIDGEDWIKADTGEFSLAPGETYSFYVVAEPINVSAGNYYANIDLKRDNVIYRKRMKFKLRESESLFASFVGFVSYNRYWIYTGLVVLLLSVILLFFIRERARSWKIRRLINKAVKQEKQKDASQKDEKKNVRKGKKKKGFKWLHILIGVFLITAVYLGFQYSDLLLRAAGYIQPLIVEYIWYIILGFFLLAVIIAILASVDKKK